MAPATASNATKITALQAQLTQVQQQLTHHTQQSAHRHEAQQQRFDQVVADQSRLKQQLAQLVTVLHSTANAVAGAPVLQAAKRAHVVDSSASALDRDVILDTVFSYVGIKEYVYKAAVSRRWRGRYIKLCYSSMKSKTGKKADKLRTSHRSAARTAARLQLAIDSGLTIAARLYGIQWTDDYWLHKCGCPCSFKNIAHWAVQHEEEKRPQWCDAEHDVSEHYNKLFWCAGQYGHTACLEGLHAQGADWPAASYSKKKGTCWAVPGVQWALQHGCTWDECHWQCDDVMPGNRDFICVCFTSIYEPYQGCIATKCGEKAAEELFAWAHQNGCPCTCEEWR
eukprot:6937-Heterococcus_DN1.PRE.3